MPTVTSVSSKLNGAQGVFARVVTWATYGLFFLIPIFFLPWTSTVLELNKQMLLVVLTVVGLVAWLGQMVLSKRLTFRSGWINIIPGLFFLAVLISSILSVSGYQTWVGQASQEYTSFLSTSMFIVLFYMIMNNMSGTLKQRNILFTLLISATLVGVIALFGMLDLVHLPFDFAQSRGFNMVGTINSFISFMTVMMFVGLSMWLVSNNGRDRVIPIGRNGKIIRGLIIAITVVNLVALIAIDFGIFWLINIFGVLLLGVFAFVQTQEFPNPRRFALPLVVLFISIVFFFLPSPINLSLPVVVSPSYGTSWEVTKTTMGVEKSNLLFGSGPGTYLYDFLAYKPVEVNASRFWSVRFDRAKSYLITSMATLGVVGTVLWLALMVWVGVKALGRLVLERDHEEWKMTYVIFTGWAMLLVTHLAYSSNMTMQFLLWGFTGLLASQVVLKLWKSDFARSPRLGLITSSAFVVVAVGVLASLFVTGQRYSAEVAFAKAVELDQNDAPIAEVVEQLQVTVGLNGLSDAYQRNLASALLQQARDTIAEFDTDELTPEQTQVVADIVTAAIAAGERATQIEPNYVSNWIVRGSLYRDLMGFARGAEDLAASMFLNAIQLEALNPAHRTSLGRVYLTVADRARALKNSDDPELAAVAVESETNMLAVAEQAFTGAIQLKNDYLPAHYYLSATYERQGRLDQAAARLLALRNNNLADIGVAFQLSQLLIRLEQYDSATQELERIVTLNPDYSNGLWYLASMYEIAGESDAAIKLLERVVELNPENAGAVTRLERMSNGEVTTTIPEPVETVRGTVTDVDEGEVVEDAAEEVVEEETEE
ncbi:tetratricopeptide repeat protein [Candidatus Uhrbacteria bacterium]|nr:tetratricopeptide repeat protein [Candidatus Uhrbacteria bacterium]